MQEEGANNGLIEIGKRIKDLRVKAGYSSYEKFALDHGIEGKQYWRLESGKDFKMTTLLRIAEIHQISLEEFFRGL
ncbi:hypothetical protein BFP97_16465 [Roseivirga sp. 4D4]|uniref:helix-turn-helix transcriptional regulator n=1 Tax=Roseivirga sp. 4D4 TaxID=1889784 RepID=UPI000853E2CB|nr:helix-turn-helix domain-containing protein [Roseivirga sp. 4D4]OEK03018.1 hypothetical protein BFP97_16465 [Roseivirga sp. 4D4]